MLLGVAAGEAVSGLNRPLPAWCWWAVLMLCGRAQAERREPLADSHSAWCAVLTLVSSFRWISVGPGCGERLLAQGRLELSARVPPLLAFQP